MSTLPVPRFTMAQYFAYERGAEMKHEFIDGQIVAMAGGSPVHSLIAANVGGELRQRLRRKCTVYTSDLRVRISDRLISYPDVSVVCGTPSFLEGDANTLTNPTLLVEVLSPSTENYDRNRKSPAFQQLPSMVAYLLVSPQPVEVEYWERQSDGSWVMATIRDREAVINIQPLGIDLPVAEIYLGVE